jgi:hypothetical protein
MVVCRALRSNWGALVTFSRPAPLAGCDQMRTRLPFNLTPFF